MIWIIIVGFIFLIFYSLLTMVSIEEKREYLKNFFKFDNNEDNDSDKNDDNEDNDVKEE